MPDAESGETFAHDAVGRAGFLDRLRPAVDQRADGLPSVRVADRKLERRWARAAANTADAHAVGSGIRQLDRREVGDAVRRDVAFRIAEFIEKLFLDRVGVDASPARRRAS